MLDITIHGTVQLAAGYGLGEVEYQLVRCRVVAHHATANFLAD